MSKGIDSGLQICCWSLADVCNYIWFMHTCKLMKACILLGRARLRIPWGDFLLVTGCVTPQQTLRRVMWRKVIRGALEISFSRETGKEASLGRRRWWVMVWFTEIFQMSVEDVWCTMSLLCCLLLRSWGWPSTSTQFIVGCSLSPERTKPLDQADYLFLRVYPRRPQ